MITIGISQLFRIPEHSISADQRSLKRSQKNYIKCSRMHNKKEELKGEMRENSITTSGEEEYNNKLVSHRRVGTRS
jgi:hypothetical protein